MKAFISGNGMKILANFEEKYKCAGFCKTPLFYATKGVLDRP